MYEVRYCDYWDGGEGNAGVEVIGIFPTLKRAIAYLKFEMEEFYEKQDYTPGGNIQVNVRYHFFDRSWLEIVKHKKQSSPFYGNGEVPSDWNR